jgi:hypothetical protein
MELKAVGLTREGNLVALRSTNAVRGLAFAQILISHKQRFWAEKNRMVLESALLVGGSLKFLTPFDGCVRPQVQRT